MNRTPSALRWMVEKRAALAGEVQRLDELARRITEERTARIRELAALDETMCLFDARLDPTAIPAVRSWAGRYGKRGGLKEVLRHALQVAYPQPVTTTEAALQACAMLKLDFTSFGDYRRWVDNSLAKQLKRFVSEGIVERLHEARSTGEVGRWRWVVEPEPSVTDMRRQAVERGLDVAAAEDEGQ